MYSFSENSGGKLPEQEALIFNFFNRNSYYCFCDISEITTPLCLKFCTEVTSHVPYPTPQVSIEWVSPFGTYEPFPKVTCYKTVQNSEVVRYSTCHGFIL